MKKTNAIVVLMILLMSIAVQAVAPVITSTPVTTANVGMLYTYDVEATDAEFDPLTFSLLSFPTGMTINPTTGLIQWTPATTGSAAVTVRAAETANASSKADQAYTITVTNPPANLEISNIALGGAKQERSNPEADDEEDQVINTSMTFTIKNIGGATASNVQLALQNVESRFNVVLSVTSFTSIAPGEQKDVTITATVPEDLDAVDAELKVAAIKIGQLKATANGGAVTTTKDITMQAINQLEVSDVNVCVNDDCEDVQDGDDVKDIKPGDQICVELEIKNNYNDNDAEDLDMEDIEANIVVEDNDFDVDEDEDLGDLSADDEDTVTVCFDVDDEASDGKAGMKIMVSGTDQNGALHGEMINVDLDVDRENHDIDIVEMQLSPQTLSCDAFNAQLRVEIRNIGKSNEDEVKVEIVSEPLGISMSKLDIELDEDDRETQIFNIAVPAKTKAGTYGLQVKTFFDKTDLSDSESVLLTVPECKGVNDMEEQIPVQQPKVPTIIESPVVIQPPVTIPTYTEPVQTKSGFDSSAALIVMMVVGIIVLIGIGIFLAKKIIDEKNR